MAEKGRALTGGDGKVWDVGVGDDVSVLEKVSQTAQPAAADDAYCWLVTCHTLQQEVSCLLC